MLFVVVFVLAKSLRTKGLLRPRRKLEAFRSRSGWEASTIF